MCTVLSSQRQLASRGAESQPGTLDELAALPGDRPAVCWKNLGSHQIDIAQLGLSRERPQTLIGTSSIAVYHDGRTVGDNVQAVLGYSKGRRMFFSSLTDNELTADQLWVYGTDGSLQITLARCHVVQTYHERRSRRPLIPM